ncbi:hypothetical protein COV04_01200 [Candidatus Uhrbacteria bacterium CG10_big_fil_rev_8_21_14_0_10_48_11]|uniref:VTT domain-containing protein n=1 Tax=Candidatus Uhrbacteria bacterium CG10_big_fil_rev_8_21_14_0_10_48_11 TaxID=1975037 RepID=A0A2M8LFC2_9BACT|nr:MAG: hypothetical protein COV04_01200 [Candidatus Uhrbacteria bacterium CG10_big_fil_rev_8_21_14_0_10_48_11]
MHFSLELIVNWLFAYPYLVLFPAVVIEGPIVTVLAGFAVSLGYLNFLLAYTLVVVGDLVGDSLYYALGRWGRDSSLHRWGRLVGVTPERVERLDQHFEAHTGKTLLAGKFMHAIGGAILVAAGAARVRFLTFIWYNLLGTLPKSFLLLLVGYYFGKAYATIDRYLNYTGIAIIILVAFVFLLQFIVRSLRKKSRK